jgi:hypothetical protein
LDLPYFDAVRFSNYEVFLPTLKLSVSCCLKSDLAMLSSKRCSILARPIKAPGRANEETVDAQFEKEQAHLAAKRQRLLSSEEYLRRGHADKRSASEKLELLNESKLTYEEHKQIHEENARRAAELEAQALQDRLNRENADAEEKARQKAQKQQEAKQVMEANKQLAESRKERERQEKLLSHMQDRVNLTIQQQAIERRSFVL